ncbi:type III secretion system needle length determinant, SpaN/EivJ family [Iodobacter sp. LRB]|uniref:SpaN/EivJ family type III secretion system needle length determinant n=1 Tax=unclassified Iodobacter TaxID=235634 RepID=UPI000C0D2ACD|nr:type III secretion system needle length determinant, SpaN/EivJ family [Iodobacter sp. BJB302]PHU99928.1 hypothetical protein CSQ88_19820 [Iodobacter sp. BJB302]
MKIHSLGGKHLGLEERSTGIGDALENTHAHLVFNAHAKFADADADALKIMLQGLQDTGQASLLDMLGVDPTPPECQANCVNGQAETDSSADLGIALPLSWAPNLTVVLDSLSLKCPTLDPLAKSEMKSLRGQDALVSLQTLSLQTSVVLPSVVGEKLLDVVRLHSTPQSMRKISRLQEQEERGASSLFPFPPIINQFSEPVEVPMSVVKGDFVAALPDAAAPTLPLLGTYGTKGVDPVLNVTMSGASSLPSSVVLGLKAKVVAAAEHFALPSIWSISAPTAVVEGLHPLSLTSDVGQGLNTAKPDVASQVNTAVFGAVPDRSHLKLAVGGAQSELSMLAPTSVGGQIVGPLVLARGSKVSAVLPGFVGNESACELPASTSQAGQAERPVRAQELVMSASLHMLPEPNLNGPHYEFASNPAARSIPAPVLQVLPSPVEQQGFTYHFKSWGNGAFVSVNTLSAGDVRFVPSDVQVLQALQTYGEANDMPQHWRVEASERRDDEVPRRQARALPFEEENEE